MPLRSTAAKSSTFKKSSSTSPIKKFQRDIKRRQQLPYQTVYRKTTTSVKTTPPADDTTKLIIVDYNVQLDYHLRNDDLMVAIDLILNNKWSESTVLHQRYQVEGSTLEERIFSLKGLSSVTKAEIIKYRSQLPELLTVSQLYSVCQHLGNTFVDKRLELLIRSGKIRKFVITNASPIISRNIQRFQLGKISYGFENVEVIVKTEEYYKLLKQHTNPTIVKFHQFVKHNPEALFINTSEEFTQEDTSILVNHGFITLTSNHLNQIESHQYSISYPNCGTFLKLINNARVWLVKALTKTKHHELIEDEIYKKWQGVTLQGDSKLNNFRKPFYGYDLNWVLADALGAGIIEVFNTTVGRGYRLTGKV
ncbi:Meiotically up-regulated protein [Spathaspora sp. JA1]|nr:Meiotically up-regulated protein [Spathaspora sp. JA1]